MRTRRRPFDLCIDGERAAIGDVHRNVQHDGALVRCVRYRRLRDVAQCKRHAADVGALR